MFRGQADDIANFLPIHLECIQSDAEKCKKEAELVLNSFKKVSSDLNDLIDAITLKKGKSEGTINEAKKEIERLKEERKRIQEEEERQKAKVEKVNEDYQKRSTQLDNELDYQGSWGQVFKTGVKSFFGALGAMAAPFKSQQPG